MQAEMQFPPLLDGRALLVRHGGPTGTLTKSSVRAIDNLLESNKYVDPPLKKPLHRIKIFSDRLEIWNIGSTGQSIGGTERGSEFQGPHQVRGYQLA